jgi:exosome complex RNA-binding protein Rrp42 (RNase PH superfamily)
MLETVIKHSKVLDVETLGISLGKLCWRLVVEVSLLEYDGSIEDAVLLAVLALL